MELELQTFGKLKVCNPKILQISSSQERVFILNNCVLDAFE